MRSVRALSPFAASGASGVALALTAALAALPLRAQSMSVERWSPRSTLVVPEHRLTRARYPFIDVHNHQPRVVGPEQVDAIVRAMDSLSLRVMVNLSGGTGDDLVRSIRALPGRHPSRFIVFANLDFRGVDHPDWTVRAVLGLERDVAAGARGLKIFKNLGLDLRDQRRRRIPTDDPRFDPIWAKCAELGIPVLIHTGEPRPLFDPADRFNERWLELKAHPERARPPSRYPPWETIMEEQRRVFRRHPRTTFIAAHMAWLGNDLGRLGAMLDSLPNVYVEVSAQLGELGRQPRTGRDWLVRYQDRVLLGKDTWAPAEYHTYFRLFETADEHFDYYRRYAAPWKLYGLDLPDDVLRKLYYRNALRAIPAIDRTGFPD